MASLACRRQLVRSGLATSRAARAVPIAGTSCRVMVVPRMLAMPASVRNYSGENVRIFRQRTPVNVGFVIVPQQKAYVVERLGRFHRTLDSGLHFLIPFIDKVAYVHSRKEQTVTVPGQAAITKDNVRIDIDAVLYLRIVDPEKASYGVSDSIYALTQLAQTTMRSELGKISLDKCFEERESLNLNIVNAINSAALAWGAEVLRYEIKDIVPPASVKAAMDMQAEAERRKRAEILESEGRRESAINNAEGMRKSAILAAQGEAEAIRARAQAQGAAIGLLASAIAGPGGREAVSLRVAEQYVDAFGRIAKAGTTMLLPADAANPASMIAQAMSVWSNVAKNAGSGGGGAGGAGGARPPLSSLAEAFAPRADFAAGVAAAGSGDAGLASALGPAGGESAFVPADLPPAGSAAASGSALPSAYRSESSRAAGAAETRAAEQQASGLGGGSSSSGGPSAPRGSAGFTPQPY